MAAVLFPLPDRDFDVTEVAVPWKLLVEAGHEVVFATEAGGAAPACDPLLLTGVVFGKLGARPEPIAFWRRGRYYRTYPAYVEDEVRAALAAPEHFERGPRELSKRGTRDDDSHAFVVEDGRYVSGRWPGDAYLLGKRLLARLAAATAAA